MITLTGIFSESFGGTCTIRGYARYTDIVDSSYPHPHYQRPEDPQHIDDISKFITSGSNSFSPEVVLAYTAEYDYYAPNANGEVKGSKLYVGDVVIVTMNDDGSITGYRIDEELFELTHTH